MELYDSIDARLIPAGARAVAGYGDGAYIWSPNYVDGSNWFDLFPSAVQLVIVVSAAHAGDVLDVERFDATPADCPGWADRFNRPGRRLPSLYHSRDLRGPVLAAMAGRPYDWWAATLDGTTDVPGAVAVQYLDTGEYDVSAVHDLAWLGVLPSTAGGDGRMGFLSRDVTGEALDEVYVSGGEAQWGGFPGGAGEWIAGAVPTNLGSPGDAKDLVDADGAFTTHNAVERLNVRGVRRDGSRWVKVMSLLDFQVLQPWTQAGAGPAQDVQVGGTVPQHKHGFTASGTSGGPI